MDGAGATHHGQPQHRRGTRGGRRAQQQQSQTVSLRVGHALVRCELAQLAEASRQMGALDTRFVALDGAHEVAGIVELALGPRVGVSQVCKLLKEHAYGDLAKQYSGLHSQRNIQAHAPAEIAKRMRKALGQIKRCDDGAQVAGSSGALQQEAALDSSSDGVQGSDDCLTDDDSALPSSQLENLKSEVNLLRSRVEALENAHVGDSDTDELSVWLLDGDYSGAELHSVPICCSDESRCKVTEVVDPPLAPTQLQVHGQEALAADTTAAELVS